VPRIDAPTVAEHIERRRRRIIDAAVAVLGESGPDHLTVGEVARRSGLARSSVYRYFPSTAALLAGAVEARFGRVGDDIATAVARADTPADRIDRFVDAILRHGHITIGTDALANVDDACRARIADLHRDLMAPLIDALAAVGVEEPRLAGELAMGVVNAAMLQIERGVAPSTAIDAARRFIRGALALPAGDPEP